MLISLPATGLFLDLEVNPTNGAITQVGATLGEWRRKDSGVTMPSAWREIEAMTTNAAYLAGHNLLDHDLSVIARVRPDSPLLRLPIIDTLVLSTLAFPKRPFHALTKDYKRSDAERNNPLFDCDRSRTLFSDCLGRLTRLLAEDADRMRVYAALLGLNPKSSASQRGLSWLAGDRSGDGASPVSYGLRLRRGFSIVLESLGLAAPGAALIHDSWMAITDGEVCRNSADRILQEALTNFETPAIALAFAVAWMSERNATFPPWALHRYRDTVRHLRRMRSETCASPDCVYCNQSGSPTGRLREFFGFPSFFATPEVKDRPGVSLQQEMVRLGMADTPLLGILPTGGGKSFCFQIPALHRHRAHGSITVVISPLQSLMKDQVENLRRRFGISAAGAIYGGISAPERQLLLNDIADGTIGLLYISPEQLRNTAIKKLLALRDIGAWVFDEAHCLAKWGHDFRPDFLNVVRAIQDIARAQSVPLPPVQAYTATAKADVRVEIQDHFEKEIGAQLTLLDGGAERANLHYRVETLPEARKEGRIVELLADRFGDGAPGSAIIFCASRKDTEKLAAFISTKGFPCRFFHAGIENREDKEKIQDEFMSGNVRVIAATNAFGMGVDKENIRVVIHHKMPGSLENYLQEAGRAGRDGQPAEAVLLYDPVTDSEWQLDVLDMSKLLKRDIEAILRTVRNRAKQAGRNDSTVLSATEIAEAIRPVASVDNGLNETAIKAAIAHLERCELLVRDDNVNRVFQVRPLCANPAEAADIIARLALSDADKALWRSVMKVVFDPTVSTPAVFLETLCALGDMRFVYEHASAARGGRPVNERKEVIGLLTTMCGKRIGLLERALSFSAVIRTANARNPLLDWNRLTRLETRLLQKLAELQPDLAGAAHPIDYAALAHELTENKTTLICPDTVRRLVERWPYDLHRIKTLPQGLSIRSHGASGTLTAGKDSTWSLVREVVELRQQAGGVIAEYLLSKARRAQTGAAKPSVEAQERDPQLDFTDLELAEALSGDLALAAHGLDQARTLNLILHTLVALDKTHCLQLVQGKSIITSAMTLRVPEGTRQRRYTPGDQAPIDIHHKERVFQVHVMAAFARRFATAAEEAYELLVQYFVLTKAAFISRYFSDDPKQVDLACTLESFFKITRNLSPIQSAIVCDKADRNLMILAGPGSGKTRVIVHRAAFLLKVLREKPERIAIVCYNRHAAIELRRRLHDLAGSLAARVIIGTYHSLALRLTGRRLDTEATRDDRVFETVLLDAIALLEGKSTPEGEDESEFLARLQGGFSHIFVDEYQDITDTAYRFVAALAGKDAGREARPCLTAVGDDDQSIYGFLNANIGFIRRFESDYQAESRTLLENFRSSPAIIDAANRVIALASGRVKHAPGTVDSARADGPFGGLFAARDSFARGRVQILIATPASDYALARAAVAELRRLRKLDPEARRSDFAVISPVHDALVAVRHLFEITGIPLVYRAGKVPYDFRAERSCAALLGELRADPHRSHDLRALQKGFASEDAEAGAALAQLLHELALLVATESDSPDSPLPLPGSVILRHLSDGLRELNSGLRQGDGVLLTTAHGAKGLEFDHVLILDHPQWDKTDDETRRLFYVAMTRARKTLGVIATSGRGSRFTRELLQSPGILQTPSAINEPDPDPRLRYHIVGLDEIVLSYAGWHAPDARIHCALARLRPGDALALELDEKGKVHVLSPDKVRIARFATKAEAEFGQLIRTGRVSEVRLLALVERRRDQTPPAANQPEIRCDGWEIPIAEVVLLA